MKGYGLPRVPELEYPDINDIKYFGLKSSTGRVADGRDDHGHQRAKNRRAARRYWKKAERARSKTDIRNYE